MIQCVKIKWFRLIRLVFDVVNDILETGDAATGMCGEAPFVFHANIS